MGLEDLLEKADESILAQFEKVTQYAHKKMGWDKWDLVKMTFKIGGVGLATAGLYCLGAGLIESKPFYAGAGAVQEGLSYLILRYTSQFCNRDRNKELEQLMKSGASTFKGIDSSRPLLLGFNASLSGIGGHMLYVSRYSSETQLNVAHSNSGTALGLSLLIVGIAGTFLIAGSYFSSTNLTPPATKKNPLKSLYEKIKETILPEPKKEPAVVPVSTNYCGLQRGE